MSERMTVAHMVMRLCECPVRFLLDGKSFFDLPCRNEIVTMLSVNPTHPIININFGSSTFSTVMKRSMDCRKMLVPRASKKTPLKKAPRRRARCHPKENPIGEPAPSVF